MMADRGFGGWLLAMDRQHNQHWQREKARLNDLYGGQREAIRRGKKTFIHTRKVLKTYPADNLLGFSLCWEEERVELATETLRPAK